MTLVPCTYCRTPMFVLTECPGCGATRPGSVVKKAVAGALLLATAGCVYGVPEPLPDAGTPETDAGEVSTDAGDPSDSGS